MKLGGQDRLPVSELEPRNKFFAALCAISDYELAPGNAVSLFSEVDLTRIERLRGEAAAAGAPKPSYTAFVVKAMACALGEFPYANRRVTRRILGRPRVQRFHRIDAVVLTERKLPDSPMVTSMNMLRDADRLSVEAINRELAVLAASDVTTNRQWRLLTRIINWLPMWLTRVVLRMPALFPALWVRYRGGSFVVTWLAQSGVDIVAATWPWSLGVSFGAVRERPRIRGAEFVACPTFTLTLNFDRRLMAGAPAARFFARVLELLEQPAGELAGAEPAGTALNGTTG